MEMPKIAAPEGAPLVLESGYGNLHLSSSAQFTFREVASVGEYSHSKVSIVGVGQVGMACAYAILNRNLASEVALVDMMPDKLKGEMMDLQHGLSFAKNCKIRASTDYGITANSNIIIITAGARQREGETRLSLVQRNVDILKNVLPKLLAKSPNPILLLVTNPVDVLTYAAWKLSGLRRERVFGSGTNLDTGRFRFLISEKYNVSPNSCHGWIIGEHGDSSVPVWSSVNIAGVPLRNFSSSKEVDKDEDWERIHKEVVDSAYQIIKLKGYTSWGIGMSVAKIVHDILGNTRSVCALSTNVKGMHGIEEDCFMSLPCVVGEEGLTHIIEQQLTGPEREKLMHSAETIIEAQKSIKFE